MKGKARVDWKGCGTSLVTPFDDRGRIDFDAIEKLVDWQIDEGIGFLVSCGAPGESGTISGDERKAVTTAVVRAARGRVPVIAGAGGNHTAKSVLWARDAARAGADGILSVSPDGQPSLEGLYRHFSAIAEATDVPILVSNVPSRTGTDLDVDTILRLAEIPNVVGIKESCLDFGKIVRLLAVRPEGFRFFSGDDVTALAAIALGGEGLISVTSNEIPAEMAGLVNAALGGDFEKARRFQMKYLQLMEVNALESSPGPVKCGLSLLKRCGETMRLPAVPVHDETRERIETILSGLRLLPRKAARAER
ncbi:MAG TPA: 4-hydroxy-tetrahydrodipicolinate synthase [Thermoanaerobaculia bacterium]|nr:4-hydroxy-tetrahydrodipicolinate synthase [Thermoanaerobaculia bacterium]